MPFLWGIWLDLEKLTGAWAQKYGSVWIITGPVFNDKTPIAWLGETEKKEFQIAIPDALFKIVVKDSGNSKKPDVLAFVYSQEGEGYTKKPFNHGGYLKSVDYIEELTGLDFLTTLDNDSEESIESVVSGEICDVEKEFFIGACKR